MDRIKDLLSFFTAAMAMVALLCAIYEAMNQRVWSSGALAARVRTHEIIDDLEGQSTARQRLVWKIHGPIKHRKEVPHAGG